jgi:hypothetical protein
MSGAPSALSGAVACNGPSRIETCHDFEHLAHQAGHRRLLADEAHQKVGQTGAFLFGPLRRQHLDHMSNQS